MQAISEIIKHSSYLEDAQKTLTNNDNEANAQGEIPGGGSPLRWYNLSTDIKVLGWDDVQGDWAYEITYVIQPYDTPSVSTTYSNPPTKYYGPAKRYKYWYTGLNTEIIQYEQTLNNNWFNAVLAATGNNSAQGGPADIPTIANVPNTGIKIGSLPGGSDAQNAYVTSLYDPGGWVDVKVKILGDPDFLTTNPPGGVSEVYNQFYHNDRTINANGGHVHIEIDFSEGIDYNNNNGTMDINSSIFITDYPPEAKIEGICYLVREVKSTFVNGSFTQEIIAQVIAELPKSSKAAADAARPELATAGRGASSEGNAGEAEAQANLAAQKSAATDAGLPPTPTAAAQITTPAPAPAATQTSFSEAQLKWLDGADQTDPFIIARMKAAVPDTPSAGTSTSNTPAAKVVANDDAAVKASDLSVYPANNPDAGRENLSQTDRASGA